MRTAPPAVRALIVGATAALVALTALILAPPARVVHAVARPDLVVIVTDDQRSDMLQYMPLTRSWLPVTYRNAFVSNPVCCPSRTSIFTSTYSHDNGVWTNKRPYGGWAAFAANGWPGSTIADALQGSGYRTGLFGKFLNAWDGTIPPGWDAFAAHLPAATKSSLSPYYDYTLRLFDGASVADVSYGQAPGDYSTTVTEQLATDFVRSTPPTEPLFLYFAPSAPHSAAGGPPIPAPQDLAAPVTLAPASPNVNEADVSDKPAYIRGLATIATTRLRRWRKAQARSLYAEDRAIDAILTTIAQTRDLSNTLVLVISDNGFANGSHRWMSKGVPYDEALRVPMLARFDGHLAAGDRQQVVDNLDIAPTLAEAAGIPFPTEGGLSLLGSVTRDHMVIEGGADGTHTFCGVRTSSAKYVKYESGEEEFYDLSADPYELVNDPTASAVAALRRLAESECSPLPPGWPRPTL